MVEALVRPLKRRRAAVAERMGSDALRRRRPKAVGNTTAEAPGAWHWGRTSAPARSVACDTEWRRFASRREAATCFPACLRETLDVLISNNPKFLAPQHIREPYEART